MKGFPRDVHRSQAMYELWQPGACCSHRLTCPTQLVITSQGHTQIRKASLPGLKVLHNGSQGSNDAPTIGGKREQARVCCRPRRCSLARVQPALKYAMCEGAHITTLACSLHEAPLSHQLYCTQWSLPPCALPAGMVSCRCRKLRAGRILGAAHLAEVWAGSGHILVDCRIPSPCLLSRVSKDTEGPVVWLLVLALRHLNMHA